MTVPIETIVGETQAAEADTAAADPLPRRDKRGCNGVLDVMCVGSAKCDTLILVDRLPDIDGRTVASDIVPAIGGNANTAAVALAMLECAVGLKTTIGDDEAGQRIMERLASQSISTHDVCIQPGARTPHSYNIIQSATETRAIITQRALAFDVETIDRRGAQWLHFDGEGYRAFASRIRDGSLGAFVSIDAGIDLETDDLRGIDLYAPNRAALEAQFGTNLEAAVKAAHRAGAQNVVVTLGAEGSVYFTGDRIEHIPAPRLPIVSSLGAGDVFHGALVAFLVKSRSLRDAVRLANCTAALSCRALDGQSGIPGLDEVEACFTKTY